MFIATLIAADRLGEGDISAARDALRDAGLAAAARSWIEPDIACDLLFSGAPALARTAIEGLVDGVDVIVQSEESRVKRLLVADMDSTMITVECIDELADYAGLKAEIAEITERAMRGELEFEAALGERVGLLRDLDEAMIDRCREERVAISPGARTLVRTMRREGFTCVLVSGGFTRFADPVAQAIGFDKAVANVLGTGSGRLDGTVTAPIIGAAAKRDTLLEEAARIGVPVESTLAIGDGANDVPMLEAAGLGIAYRAKPAAVRAADARLDHCALDALLYAQGYSRREWEVD